MVSNGGTGTRTTAGHTLNPHPKGLLGGRYGRKVLPPSNQAVMFQLRIEPSSKEASEQILKLLSPLTEITKTDMFVVSSYIIQGPGWWRRNPDKKLPVKLKIKGPTLPTDCYTKSFGSPLTIEFQMICSTSTGLRHKFPRLMVNELVAQIEASLSSEFIVTGENLKDETLQELLEYFEDNKLFTSDRRSLLSGFLLHPFYTKDWSTSSAGRSDTITNAAKKEQAAQSKKKTIQSKKKTIQSKKKNVGFANALEGVLGNRLGLIGKGKQEVAASNKEPSPKAFHIRYHRVKQAPEAVVLEARSKRIPIDIGGDESSTKFSVPLVDFLRTITRVGHSDKEIPIGTLFGVLERMRSMLSDVAYVNSLGNMNEEERETLVNIERFKRVFTKLALMGRGEYQKRHFGKKQLEIDSLEELVRVIEKEYSVLVERGRKAVCDCSSIEYMSLQELYKIGSVVTTRSIPSLGGLQASFKVRDCMYEPIRSLMGSLRYSFRVTLEAIVWMGKHFVSVHFQEIIGDWRSTKPIRALHYQPTTANTVSASSTAPTNSVPASSTNSVSASLPQWISKRIQLLNDMCIAEETFSYMEYQAGSFFPSLSRQMRVRGKSSGAASSSITRSGGGQLIVDVLTGINLGYAAASRTGDFGNALGLTTQLYLDYLRKSKGSKISLEDLNNSHEGLFTAYETFPKGINAQPWPCVIGFSMNVKSWGYALIDRLRPVLPDPRPWLELVLPPATKEMLMSLTRSKVKKVQNSTSRYRYEDVIPGKGMGGLYLLYGPPGTGKTLTVEALARFFGKPLYSISFAELGSSTAELEETLTETLHLAGHWGCLALLDEGDALVEKRKQGQLLLNSMTGVLLRLLENFEGSLFINSNRVSSFDPAALSRVTLAVKFTPLSTTGMYHVWRNSIARVLKSDTTRPKMTYEDAVAEAEKKFDLDTLAKFPGSGRSIGAVMKMAIAISSSRDCELTNGVIQECSLRHLEETKEFLDSSPKKSRISLDIAEIEKASLTIPKGSMTPIIYSPIGSLKSPDKALKKLRHSSSLPSLQQPLGASFNQLGERDFYTASDRIGRNYTPTAKSLTVGKLSSNSSLQRSASSSEVGKRQRPIKMEYSSPSKIKPLKTCAVTPKSRGMRGSHQFGQSPVREQKVAWMSSSNLFQSTKILPPLGRNPSASDLNLNTIKPDTLNELLSLQQANVNDSTTPRTIDAVD
eukprot:g2408.t1